MTVLVLTAELDPTADLVIQQLTDRGVPVYRCDAREFPQRLGMSAQFRDGAWTGWLRTPEREVALEAIRAIYYRRPSAFAFTGSLTSTERRFAAAEARFGFGGVLAALPTRWVNNPHRMAEADYKPLQLQVAAQCGLMVPHTLITNVPDALRRFGARSERVIYKSLSGEPDYEEGHAVALYTNVVSPDDYDAASIASTAHLFQEWVPKHHEVRVTVAGERQFAVEIHAQQSPRAAIDWRTDYDAHRYEVTEIPDATRRAVSMIMERFGLAFGALDFVVTPDGEWVFLEPNPNGQWGWLEFATGLPIASAIADILAVDVGSID